MSGRSISSCRERARVDDWAGPGLQVVALDTASSSLGQLLFTSSVVIDGRAEEELCGEKHLLVDGLTDGRLCLPQRPTGHWPWRNDLPKQLGVVLGRLAHVKLPEIVQRLLGRDAVASELLGAFFVELKRVAGSAVILVDDRRHVEA